MHNVLLCYALLPLCYFWCFTMQKILVFFGLTLLVSFVFAGDNKANTMSDSTSNQIYSKSEKTPIAVLPLSSDSQQRSLGDVSDAIYQRIVEGLLKTKKFEPIERSQIAVLLKEGQFQNSGITDDDSAIKLGKLAGAQFVTIGSYVGQIEHKVDYSSNYKTESYPANLSVNVRLVDVQTGKIANSFSVESSSSGSSKAASINELLNGFSSNLEITLSQSYKSSGYIIRAISSEEYVIDLGQDDGLQKGDKLAVLTYGDDIIHPITGKVIKGEQKELAQAEVKTVSNETSIVKVSSKLSIPIGTQVETKARKKEEHWCNKAGLIGCVLYLPFGILGL